MPNFATAPGEPTEAHDEGRYQSVLTELDLAITCCGTAQSAPDKSRAQRNFETAARAYSDGLYYLIGASSDASISRLERHRVMAKLALLDRKFGELGV